LFKRSIHRSFAAILGIVCALNLTAFDNNVKAAEYPQVSAECAVLTEKSSGRVVYEKNSHTVHPIASTTKIMTAVVAIENSTPDTIVTVDAAAVGTEGSSVYLKAGETLTMEQLLYAMMLESANYAAAAIAIAVSGSIADFAALMNAKAEELGLEHTSYADPHGLDDEGNRSCAADLAKLAAYALDNGYFRSIVSTERQVITNGEGDAARLLVNHNKLLRLYDGTIGVKTGFTKKSGRCLVSAAERNGVTLIAVTLGAPDDWNDHMSMLNYGFERFVCRELAAPGSETYEIPVVGGEAEFVRCSNTAPLSVVTEIGAPDIEKTVELKRFYYAPVSAGEILGYVTFRSGGEVLGRVEIKAETDLAQKSDEGIIARLLNWFKGIGGK